MELDVIVTPGLGDSSYLIASGDQAALVDPQRDVGRFLAAARARGASVRQVLETHVHNDYVSGALDVRAATGAQVVAPARGRYSFPYRGVAEGDELEVGDLRITVMETPGHTPEHVSYLVHERGSDKPVAVFTGGSLMVGNAGRTDLLGAERAEELARAQYHTLRRLTELADEVQVLPTHGAGSFCGSGAPLRDRTSTMGEERVRNRALQAPDVDSFVRQHLTGLLAFPDYYAHMAPINRAGPRPFAEIEPPRPLTPDEFAARMADGSWAVDARLRGPFAWAHVPGSVNIELGETFASYVGWIVPWGLRLVLVLPEPEEESAAEAATQLARIGYEQVDVYLAGGIDRWRADGREVASYRIAGLEELCRAHRSDAPPNVLDVRQQVEWDRGHIPGSRHVFVGDLPDRLGDVPRDGEVWVICASGQRASIAASLLQRAGIASRLVDGTGVRDFLKHCVR